MAVQTFILGVDVSNRIAPWYPFLATDVLKIHLLRPQRSFRNLDSTACVLRQPPESEGLQRGLMSDDNINSTRKRSGRRITTITVTFVSTIGVPVPTSTARSTSSRTTRRSLHQPTPTTHLRPTPSSTLPAGEANLGPRSALPSPAIIGIVVAAVVLLFIPASYAAWRRRRRRTRTQADGQRTDVRLDRSRAGIRPLLLPNFSFEAGQASRENRRPTSYAAGPSSRLNQPSSAGVNGERAGYQTTKPDASRGNMVVYAPSFGLRPPTNLKATVVNTFFTDLADELPVRIGEKLRVLAKYDDGWTLCVNEMGDQGMVPVECLAVYRGKE